MKQCQGRIEEIIFYNEDNSYTIAAIETDMGQILTVVGHLPFAQEGRSFIFYGEERQHPVYGHQFAFDQYEELVPTTKESIELFLSSGVIKGIGPKMAERIIHVFGADALYIIGEEPYRLAEIEGIGSKKAQAIAESYQSHREIGEIIMFLQQYGISARYGMKLYQIYGGQTIQAIKENPFRLVEEVWGIGFRTADEIAVKMGVEKDSQFRLESGIKYLLNAFAGEGHTFCPKDILVEKATQLLEVSGEQLGEVLAQMAFLGEIRLENIENREAVFLMPFYIAETNACNNLVRLIGQEHMPITADVEGLVDRVQGDLGIQLAENQKEAVKAAVENGVCVITGGPGTGKTTTIHTIIQVFERSGLKTSIAAPTGRAAKRITETAGAEAKTIHRLLEYAYTGEDSNEMRFGRNQENPIDADVVIIDEASMIDILLMNGLLNGMKHGSRLILVGDADQLPPVGPGSVLKDIIESELVYTVRLDRIFRQAEESLIVVNAHRINQGEYPSVNEKDKDFFFLQKLAEEEILTTIMSLCTERLPSYYQNCDPMKDVQVLTPIKKGTLGTFSLNNRLQQVFNPPGSGRREKKMKNRVFREGDKVMQIRNNYEIKWKRLDNFMAGEGVYNGDIGYISRIDDEANEIIVVFEEIKAVCYDFTQIDELELAYAITVHKSQGSEYPVVVMPLVWFPPMLATRNLLYTAVTRAKKGVVMVGNRQVMNAMVDNNRIVRRYSGLKARLAVFLEFMS